MALILLCLAACAAGVGLTLYADATQRPRLEWIGKPLAALAFILAGTLWGALDSSYGQWILAGLVLGALGDVLLIPRSTGLIFMGGMLAFGLGHGAYVVAFAGLPLSTPALWLSGIGMAAFSVFVLRWLMPHVPGEFKIPVLAYLGIIGLMTVLAIAASAAGASWAIAIGGVAFALSDLAVARERFVAPGKGSRIWGLPLYFGAQMIIAATVSLVGPAP